MRGKITGIWRENNNFRVPAFLSVTNQISFIYLLLGIICKVSERKHIVGYMADSAKASSVGKQDVHQRRLHFCCCLKEDGENKTTNNDYLLKISI